MRAGAADSSKETRFAFGENWRRFLELVDERRIAAAQESLTRLLGDDGLADKSFLDVGCGSGLFSLAARRLGARVHAFDDDPESVACAHALAARYARGDSAWTIERGSVLDEDYVRALGRFDVVYAWGVLHHTGAMYAAIENATRAVAEDGRLCLSIYNDQGLISRYWWGIKYLYNAVPVLRPLLVLVHLPYPLGARLLVRALTGRLQEARGMSYWHDLIDWLGGFPFEVARPDEIVDYLGQRGFRPLITDPVRGNRSGCNEFVFARRR